MWPALLAVRWSKVIPVAIILGLIISVGAYIAILKIQVKSARAERDAATARELIADANYNRCKINRETLLLAIDDQNKKLDLLRKRGEELQEAQRRADRLAMEMATATAELERIRADHQELVRRARDLDVCATYRLALEAIAE